MTALFANLHYPKIVLLLVPVRHGLVVFILVAVRHVLVVLLLVPAVHVLVVVLLLVPAVHVLVVFPLVFAPVHARGCVANLDRKPEVGAEDRPEARRRRNCHLANWNPPI